MIVSRETISTGYPRYANIGVLVVFERSEYFESTYKRAS